MRGSRRRTSVVALAPAALLLVALGACAGPAAEGDTGGRVDVDQVDAVEAPTLGACRPLVPADIAEATNATETVDCDGEHTSQTYAVGDLPGEFDDAAYDAPEVSEFAYATCTDQLAAFLGADVSLAMRTVVTWAWFRPSQEAWQKGARWYRCDAVGGTEASDSLLPLPTTAEGLLQGRPDDRWLVCVTGPNVADSPKVPCSQKHDWRAVTTVKIGEPDDDYPGDRAVEVKTRQFCSDSVRAWLNYPPDFDYGYTWFHEPEWDAGNRRSICWAKTDA